MKRPEDALQKTVSLTILGEPASKANSRKLTTDHKTGKPRFIKSEKALNYAQCLKLQVPIRRELLEGPLCASLWIYYASQRPDLDESLILDGLQGRIYKNDRQVREKHIYHGVDKTNPRTEIIVEPI